MTHGSITFRPITITLQLGLRDIFSITITITPELLLLNYNYNYKTNNYKYNYNYLWPIIVLLAIQNS
jgi:hypothetical protein